MRLTAARAWEGTFPDRCVSCGGPQETESALVLTRLVARGRRQEEASVRLRVPHCGLCARASKSVFLAGCLPFTLGFLLVGAAGFLLAVYGSWVFGLDEAQAPGQAQSPSLVLGAAAGLFGGFVGGFVFELLARLLLIPFYGRALLRAPMLAKQFITDEDYVAGLTGRLDRDATRLTLEFSNDEVAAEFARLNPA
jgi:UPF0716 family protein affecting phage T7 exclusion